MKRGLAEPWLASSALPRELGADWARSWPSWFGPGQVRMPRTPEKEELARVETVLGPVVAKRFQARGWKRSLELLRARVSRPERAFRNAQALTIAGFSTPEPLAVLGRPEDAVLVTRYVAGRGLWVAWGEDGGVGLCAELARGLARLHAAGFRHRDLKASNLLVGDGGSLVWTDLDGLRRLGTIEPRLRARDLARLATSFESSAARAAGVRAGDWPGLVRRYLGESLGRNPREEELVALLGWTRVWKERWIRRHLARGRVVQ